MEKLLRKSTKSKKYRKSVGKKLNRLNLKKLESLVIENEKPGKAVVREFETGARASGLRKVEISLKNKKTIKDRIEELMKKMKRRR